MTDGLPSPDGPNKFPTEEELPDEPKTVDDLNPFSVDNDDFENIDYLADAGWKDQSTAGDRIPIRQSQPQLDHQQRLTLEKIELFEKKDE